ncbi:MAG: tRNA pseudouridine(55) synthase TruB [Pirellulaceae bacterium]|nr:tRNA pseudouridine(55) synthase TruB [Pirellulaceae bacterium]
MFGLLNINKPAGMTSRDVVNHVQRLVRPAKVGHAGTLDPLATGVLVVCIGPATRLIEYVQRQPKQYTGSFLLGRKSDTEDVEGQVLEIQNAKHPSREDITAAVPRFLGSISQRPPVYSALKIDGRRAYKLAREGAKVELQPRSVMIYDLEVVDYAYPELCLQVRCGSGTYLRSLGRDLAEAVGTQAVMSGLRRTAVGNFRVEDSCDLQALTQESCEEYLISPLRAVQELPRLEVGDEETAALRQGRFIANSTNLEQGEIAACNTAGTLVAILTPRAASQLKPVKNFIA